MKAEWVADAVNTVMEHWGADVIRAAGEVKPFDGGMKEFLEYCSACGGNWGGMLLTGIRRLWPTVYDVIPEDMGIHAWACICSTLILCGVDTSR